MTKRPPKNLGMAELFRAIGLHVARPLDGADAEPAGAAPGVEHDPHAAGIEAADAKLTDAGATDTGTDAGIDTGTDAVETAEDLAGDPVDLLADGDDEGDNADVPRWVGPRSDMRFAITMSPYGQLLQVEIPARHPIVLQAAFGENRDIGHYSEMMDLALAVARDPDAAEDAAITENLGGLHYMATFFSNVAEQMTAMREAGVAARDPFVDALEAEALTDEIGAKERMLGTISTRILDRIRTAIPAGSFSLLEQPAANGRPL